MHIHSSWNSDRVAACCISKPRETAAVRRPVRMYTEFRGSALTVKTYRGAVKFAHVYEADVVGARMSRAHWRSSWRMVRHIFTLSRTGVSISRPCPHL